MAVAPQPAKAATQNERLLAVLEKEPGILSTELRSRAEEVGMKADSVSQAMYLMEKAGRIHYGESASGRNRPCFAGPAPKKAKTAPGASNAPEKTNSKSMASKKTKRLSRKTRQKSAQTAGESYPVFPAPAVVAPSTAVELSTPSDFMTLVSQPGGMEAAITSFATKLASAVAQNVANQVREQMEKQVVQQVSEAIAAQMTQLTKSIAAPGMPNTSSVALKPHHTEEERPRDTRGRKPRADNSAHKTEATEVLARPARKKVVVLGLKPRFTKKVASEFSKVVDLAFAPADENPTRLEKLLAEADEVVALTNTKGTKSTRLVTAHPGYSKLSGGLHKLVEKLNGIRA